MLTFASVGTSTDFAYGAIDPSSSSLIQCLGIYPPSGELAQARLSPKIPWYRCKISIMTSEICCPIPNSIESFKVRKWDSLKVVSPLLI